MNLLNLFSCLGALSHRPGCMTCSWMGALVLVSVFGTAHADRSYVWDLSPLFADHASWEAERDWVMARIQTIGELEGQGSSGPSRLADVLDAAYELQARATRLAIYGFLVSDADTSSERGQLYYDVGTALEPQAMAAVAFVRRAVLDVGAERFANWVEEEPRLGRHGRWVADILRREPYTPPAPVEAVIESAARWPRTSADLFAPLHAAPVGWRQVQLSGGETVTVDRATYLSFRTSAVRADRLAVTRAYFDHLLDLEEVFGLMYTRRIEADLTLARQRGYDDGMEALWFTRDGMPKGSHRPMIEVTRANLQTLRRYVALRSLALGVDRPALADLYAPVSGLPGDISIADALETSVAALTVLGPEFASTVESLLEKPWMHLEATPNKASSYAIWPSVAGSPPYFFMTYGSSLGHSRALAGGLTLQATFADIPSERTPATRDDPGIYANGVIYVGDMLHDDYVADRAKSREERVAVLVHSLDFLWQQFFRWVLLVELDVEVQGRILAGETPGGSGISELYRELQREFFGANGGTVVLEPANGAEWMHYSVPFLSFEHQFWPAATAMAAAIVERVRAGDTALGERSWRVLGRSEVDRTYQLLNSIGIDMVSREPYEAVIRRMNGLLDALNDELREDKG